MSRLNRFLLVLLVVQIAVLLALHHGAPAPTSADHGLLLDGLKVDDVTALEIVEDDSTVHLARSADEWVITEASDYPADADKVDKALRDLAAAEIADQVTQTATSHHKLEVAPDHFKRKITLSTDSGTRTVYLGTAGRAGSTYVRVEGSDAVVAVRDLSSYRFGGKAMSWIDRSFWTVERDKVQTLRLSNASGTMSLRRRGEGWTIDRGADPRPADGKAVDALLGRAVRVSLKDVVGKLDGGQKAVVTLTLGLGDTTGDDDDSAGPKEPVVTETHTLHLAGSGDDWTAWVEGGAHVVSVTKTSIQPLLDATATGLLGG